MTIHTLLGIDVNHVGDASHFNAAGAAQAIAATNATFSDGAINCGAMTGSAAIDCASAGGASMADYANKGIGSSADLSGPGGGCPAAGCGFGGLKPQYGTIPMLFPVGRSVYSGLQMKLVQQLSNPVRGFRNINFQLSYALSRFTNAGGWQGNTVPSGNPAGQNDQDFVINAADNNNPTRYSGPSLLDRTHQISFGGSFDMPWGIRWGVIAHFYSPLFQPGYRSYRQRRRHLPYRLHRRRNGE